MLRSFLSLFYELLLLCLTFEKYHCCIILDEFCTNEFKPYLICSFNQTVFW